MRMAANRERARLRRAESLARNSVAQSSTGAAVHLTPSAPLAPPEPFDESMSLDVIDAFAYSSEFARLSAACATGPSSKPSMPPPPPPLQQPHPPPQPPKQPPTQPQMQVPQVLMQPPPARVAPSPACSRAARTGQSPSLQARASTSTPCSGGGGGTPHGSAGKTASVFAAAVLAARSPSLVSPLSSGPSPGLSCLPESKQQLDEECPICTEVTLKAALDGDGLGALDCCDHLFCHG
jgi:hypothetical protein